MLDKNGKDIVTEVIEDAKNQTAQAEANATIFGKMFNVYARHCIIIRYDYRLVATEVVVSLAVVLLCIIVYLTAGIEANADPTLAIKSSFLTSIQFNSKNKRSINCDVKIISGYINYYIGFFDYL